MSDYTFQHVTGHWRHLVDDTVRDVDDLPDTITPAGSIVFTPYLGKDGQLPAGDPAALVSVDPVTALVVDGDLCDLQNRPGVKLVAMIGDSPVWWTAVPKLVWKGRTLPGKTITFGPMPGVTINLADLVDLSGVPPEQIPAYKDAAISAAQASASATTAETAAERAETAAAGVADISEQVTAVTELSATAVAAKDDAVAAKNTAVTAAESAQHIIDDAADIIRTDLTTEITTATTAATTATSAKNDAIVARDAAAGSATAASGSANAANTSKNAAAGSATSAGTAATNATAARDATIGARDAATTAAGEAASSAGAAAGSATTADESATTATTAATTATTAKNDAITARDAAAGSATAAESSATSADQSASNAAGSATDAAASKTAAGGSATAAAGSASAAAGDRAAAENAKSSAETAASNAAGSASAASSSATNAGTSATNAADSAAAAAQSAEDAAAVVNDGIANATSTTKGGIKLPGSVAGELGGTWDHPTVTGWADKADLVGGKIPSAQIPAIATTETYVVASTSERLALTCETGDIAVQTADPGKGTWILKGTDPATAGDWVQMTAPTDVVQSVNGQTGAVVLGKSDVGLSQVNNTSDSAKPISTAQQAALDGKVPTTRTISAGTGLTGGGALDANRAIDIDFGTTAGKVAQGNDSRFSDKRVPVDGSVKTIALEDGAVTAPKIASGVLPHDFTIPAVGDKSTRAVGAGDLSGGVCLQRAMTIKAVRYRCLTADASGSMTVELRKNGTAITGTSKSLASADQTNAPGAAREVSGLSVAVAKGDILTVQLTAVGTTPGKALYVDVEGVTA